MSVDPKRYKAAMKRKAEREAAAAKGTDPPKKKSSGSKAFDDAIDKLLKSKK